MGKREKRVRVKNKQMIHLMREIKDWKKGKKSHTK